MKWQAYNPDWAFNTALRAQAACWQRQLLVSPAQLAAIEAAYPLGYYRPAWPLRVGLFIFTWIALSLLGGFSVLITGGEAPVAIGLIYCVGSFGMLEFLLMESRLYHAGPDNALLYSGLGSAIGLLYYCFAQYGWTTYYAHPDLGNSFLFLLLALGLLAVATLRYADALVAAAAFIALLLLAALFGMQSPLGQALLPFLLMATAAGTLFLYRALTRRIAGTALADYYAICLLMLKILALVVFYLGGNYLVVREGNAELHNLAGSEQIPFALVFYLLTAGVPFLYITLGLRRADRPTLLLGLLALAFSLFTLRHYRSLMPPEIAAVAAGTVLTIAAGMLLRALRPARFGLTSLPDDEPRHFNLENLIQAQTAHAPAAPAGGGFEFGGGQSGGGGATGQF
ncbi:putative membrane protein YgcG [Hymenobacter sp. UYAg731]